MAAISFKRRHFQQDMILHSLESRLFSSDRDIEELMHEGGFLVDPSTINCWVLHDSPQLEAALRRKKKRVGNRWRMDETTIKVKSQWKYNNRAIDTRGNTSGFLVTATHDTKATLRF